jgi:ribonuclease HI
MPKDKPKFYVVWKGKTPGVYSTWAEAEAQVKGFAGAQFKGFPTRAEADAAFRGKSSDYIGKGDSSSAPTRVIDWKTLTENPPRVPSVAVDAACAGVPGPVEYRGVDLATGAEVFRMGPFPNGTNNIGEFLAIVHALAMLEKEGKTTPIYSDSMNALAWVKAKKCRTQHVFDQSNRALYDLIARAEVWLETHEYRNPILKWDTDNWGENPADFGRK